MKLETIVHAPRMTITLTGRLNADAAPNLEAVLDQQFQEITELVLDVDGLDYVSSVGLRVLLLAHQKMKAAHGSLLLKNVGQPIAEILEVTGLDRILHFERKHRQLSVEGLKMIAKGANGECYKVDEETVVKLYFDFVDEGCAEREKALATKAFVAGVPTALSFDVVQCGTRTGVMYEMLKADTLALYMEKNIERLNDVVAMYVRFCKQIHAIPGDTNTFPDAVTLACGYVDACEFFNDRQRAFLKERLMRTAPPGTLIPSVPIMMRHFPTLQTLWANRSLNHGRKPEESTQSSLARTSHDPTTFQPQREVAHRRSRGPLHQAW